MPPDIAWRRETLRAATVAVDPVAEAVAPVPAAPPGTPPRRRRAPLLPAAGSTTRISVATIAVLLAAWWVVTRLGWIAPLFLPPPSAVWRVLVDYALGRVNDQPLLVHLGASLGRVGAAFALACVTGVPLGVAMGVSRLARGVLDPLVEFYRPLPPLSYLPLIIVWFGIGEWPKVLLIYLSALAPVALATRAGLRGASPEQVHAAASMGASRLQLVRHVLLPAALPEILVGLRIALGFAWTTLVAAEMVAATSGMGQLVLNASNYLRTDIVVMGIVVIGGVAWGLDLAMRWIERRVVPWKGR